MARIDPTVTHDRQRLVLELMIELYGDDSNTVLNALHEISVRVGITCGVEPDAFAAGMKHHWDYFANIINDDAENTQH